MRKTANNIIDCPKKDLVLHRQQGIALPITLILLFVLTLIGIATLRTSTFEESMAANSRLRQIAYNAAETTLAISLQKLIDGIDEASTSDRVDRARFFGFDLTSPLEDNALTVPKRDSPGMTCEGGYCIPARFNLPLPSDQERWEDSTLDVWQDNTKHLTYDNFELAGFANEGVTEAPRYIVEFLGNLELKEENIQLGGPGGKYARPEFEGAYISSCRVNNVMTPPNNVWPYCAADPAAFRITVRATAGPPARQAVVFLQATYRLAF